MENVQALAEEFTACRRTLSALGDENRQYLILEMMQMGECGGVCVGRITAQTHLSRPAVSHHLQILKDAGLIQGEIETPKVRYCIDRANWAVARDLFADFFRDCREKDSCCG